MRSLQKRKQTVWFVHREKDDSSIEPVFVYDTPIKKRMSVSGTAGSVYQSYFGVLPTYDRYLITYEKDFKPDEGTMVYVDKTPEIEDGEIVLRPDREPTVKPDYVVDKVTWTLKGTKTRIGIKKVSSEGDGDE